MKCPACDFENPDGFAFCGKCGAKLAVTHTCPQCGAEVPAGFAFCGRCGASLEAGAPPTLISQVELARLEPYLPPNQFDALPPAPLWKPEDLARTQASLRELLDAVVTYLPRHLVQVELDHLHSDAPAVGGQFLDGALLFADISGFTAMSENLSTLGAEGAEQVTALANRYFSAMLDVLFAHGGDLFKFGGDALLAFFARENGGVHSALQAAWAMQQAMTAFHQVETSVGTFPLRMKIGLDAGPIFTSRVGTRAEREFIVTGPTVNATARAESLAQAGQILISATVRERVAEECTTTPGPSGHHIVTQVMPAAQPPISNPHPPLPTFPSLSTTLTALDHLTPYLPPGLLPRLVSNPSRIETGGEHRLVAILFANFVGASELITRLGPARAGEIAQALHDYFVTMREAVSRYGGVVNKIDLYDRGDKLMVLFGAPVAHEDDAERAVRAALEMQAALETLDAPWLQVQRIGISNGLVFAGHVGGATRREYTVMGDEVNLAARLMSAAHEGEILLSSFVQRKISPFFEVADRGEVSLKGKSKPVPTFTIVGRRAQPEPVRGIRGLHSPLVGREQEETTLRRLLDDLTLGRGSVVALVGEAGLGKSRLVAELRQHALASADLTWLEGRCLSYTQQVSYSAFTDLMHAALDIAPGDNAFDIRTKLRRQVEALMPGETGTDVLPYLAHFLGLALSGPEAERVAYLDGEALQRQVLRSVTAFLEHLARERPLVLAFDDLHWADSASLVLLERCLALTDRAPVLVLLIYRPERTHGCWALGQTAARDYPHRYTEIALSPLDRQTHQDEQLVRNLLSLDEMPPELAQLVSRAEGNPFYVEEIIRTLIDRGAVVRDNGGWRLAQDADLQAVPDTLQGIIMARLDQLMEEARRTLQLASVVGRTFRHQVLAWLASAAALAAQLDASLAALQRAELIRERSRIPELEFGFKHVMIRDVAYENLLVRDRRTYHHLVARYLEETHIGQKREEVYELLAHHYSHSDDQEKALEYLLKAGDKARAAYANPEAIAFYRQAQAVAEALIRAEEQAAACEGLGDVFFHIGEYDEALACYASALDCCATDAQEADIHRRIAMVHEKRGEYEAALETCTRGTTLLTPDHTDTVEMARLLAVRCRALWQQGQFDVALSEGQRGLEIVQDSAYYREIGELHNELGNACWMSGQPTQAIEHFEKAQSILERIGDEHGAARIYNNLAIIYYQTDMIRSAEYFGRALETMRRLGDVWGEATALNNLGIVHFGRGDLDQAISYYQRSLALMERLGDNQGIAQGHVNLGETYRSRGETAQAVAHLEKSLIIAQEIGAQETAAECHLHLAECYLEEGRSEQALASCEQVLQYARQTGDRSREGIIHRVFGRAHRQQGQMLLALEHLAQSVAILSELNMEFHLAPARFEYGSALAEAGQNAQAREQFEMALTLFDRLDLPQQKASVQAALDGLA